jgi:Tfp pilus assembly pilus retraction ATPase PilT
MAEDSTLPLQEKIPEQEAVKVSSLKELIDRVSGRGFLWPEHEGDSGLAESLPFPFLALVGQMEMKLALILSLVNPAVGGVLLIGPRGTGKTTAVRSLIDLYQKYLVVCATTVACPRMWRQVESMQFVRNAHENMGWENRLR